MKKFFLSCIFIITALWIIDRIGGAAMWWVNQHTHDVAGPKIKYLVSNVHEDVILMGTSRCNGHYVPSIISDSIKLSVYNGGIDASYCIYAHYLMLNHILSLHTPKVICLDVMPSDYAKDKDDAFNTISFFAPYFGKNAAADSVFMDAGTYWSYQISHLYRFNAKAVSNIAGLLVNKQDHSDNGYIPIPRPPHTPQNMREEHTPKECDSLKINYIHKFINKCKEKDIQLIFVASPKFMRADDDLYSVLKDIASQNGITFLDYHTKGLYQDHPDYFRDELHLWDKGARLYSSVFAHDLKKLLNP